ncbi:hypothetical protein MMC25_004646 [Agyrium rufum]|nr:hypothetical protein [Agyrium rufum]
MEKEAHLFFLDVGLSDSKDEKPAGRILTCHADGTNLQTVVDGIGTIPDGIAIDPENRHIYYTNMSVPSTNSGFISRVDLDGKNKTVIVPQGVTWTPKQLSLELTTRKLYWSDREGMRVFRSNLDGSSVEVLIQTAQGEEARKDARNHCVGIAVDAERRVMYWTQKGPSKGNAGRLFCAGLEIPQGGKAEDRSDVKLLLDHLPEPIDLDLDLKENLLYMSDRGDPPYGNTINRIDLNRHEQLEKKILVRKLHEAIGITLDLENKQMYMTDLVGSVYRANIDGSDQKVLFSDVGDLTGICCSHL